MPVSENEPNRPPPLMPMPVMSRTAVVPSEEQVAVVVAKAAMEEVKAAAAEGVVVEKVAVGVGVVRSDSYPLSVTSETRW